jgi:hypothetical protein
VVRDPEARRGAVDKVRSWATAHGFITGGADRDPDRDPAPDPGRDPDPDVVESPITGPAGNVEYLLLLRTAPDLPVAAAAAGPEVPADAAGASPGPAGTLVDAPAGAPARVPR